jgi:hypothetical protein
MFSDNKILSKGKKEIKKKRKEGDFLISQQLS